MDAFENNKFNENEFIKIFLSKFTIVSFGYISAIDFDSVIVTQIVSDSGVEERLRCQFMSLGSSRLSIAMRPEKDMRVMILSPGKAAENMYKSSDQIKAKEGREFILDDSPARFSSQFAFCIPITNEFSKSLSSIVADDKFLTVESRQEVLVSIFNTLEIDLKGNTHIELHEDTSHERHCYGDMEETFGMVEGIGGAEKSGDYIYKRTYGKFSSVEKNYESGFTANIGKAYETPFLEDQGELLDSSAPVTMNFGAQSPLNVTTGSPVTLVFGESAVTVSADETNGISISLTGASKISISAETGKFAISNSTGSLKDLLDKVADLFTNLTTIGGNVAPGVPYTAASTPATIALAAEIKTLAAGLLE